MSLTHASTYKHTQHWFGCHLKWNTFDLWITQIQLQIDADIKFLLNNCSERQKHCRFHEIPLNEYVCNQNDKNNLYIFTEFQQKHHKLIDFIIEHWYASDLITFTDFGLTTIRTNTRNRSYFHISCIYITKDEKNYPHICIICITLRLNLKHTVTFHRHVINNDRCIRHQTFYPN